MPPTRTHGRGTPAGSTPLEEHDVLILVAPPLAHYLLRLLADDLARSTGPSDEWRKQVLAMAAYIRDVLPEHLRIPLPVVDAGPGLDPREAEQERPIIPSRARSSEDD